MSRIPDPIQRALRTFIQAFTTIFLAAMTTPNMVHNSIPHKSALFAAVLAASWGGAIAVMTLIHNSFEIAGVVPTVLKPQPAPVVTPVVAPEAPAPDVPVVLPPDETPAEGPIPAEVTPVE